MLITVVLSLTAVTLVRGQYAPCVDTEPAKKLSVITESDYPNLLHISGLKHYSNVNYTVEIDGNRQYRLEGESKNSSLFALYDKDGNLIEASYMTKNTPLPGYIYRTLAAGSFDGWTMTSNKKVVKNFDVMQTEYEVQLKKDKMKQTLYFDHAGNLMPRLAGRIS